MKILILQKKKWNIFFKFIVIMMMMRWEKSMTAMILIKTYKKKKRE